jgi:hypothetical protein
LCVAGDDDGDVVESSDPGALAPSWRLSTVDPGQVLWSVACPSPGLCLAGDSGGRLFTARRV